MTFDEIMTALLRNPNLIAPPVCLRFEDCCATVLNSPAAPTVASSCADDSAFEIDPKTDTYSFSVASQGWKYNVYKRDLTDYQFPGETCYCYVAVVVACLD